VRKGGTQLNEPAPNWRAVEAWIAGALPLLNLQGWRITLSRVPCESDAWAEVDVHSSERDATLSLSTAFWSLSPERKRAILVHELVHVLAAPLDRLSESLESALGGLAFAIYEPTHTQTMEVVVWRVADVLAPFFPVVDDPDHTTTPRRRR
jgi:hypothetical protein